MDTGVAKAQDYSKLPTDWASAIAANGFDVDTLHRSVDAIYQSAGSHGVSPRNQADVFRAFHETQLDEVRAVILGEDPYADPDQAHGLEFSASASHKDRRPTSLGRIFGGIRRDLGRVP